MPSCAAGQSRRPLPKQQPHTHAKILSLSRPSISPLPPPNLKPTSLSVRAKGGQIPIALLHGLPWPHHIAKRLSIFIMYNGQLNQSGEKKGVWDKSRSFSFKWIRLMSYLYGWRVSMVGKVRRIYRAALWSDLLCFTLSQAVVMRGHCAPWGPWEPVEPAWQPHSHRHITISSKVNTPCAGNFSLSLSLSLYPDKWSALSSPWPEKTPPWRFFGKSTSIFSITAGS